MLLGRVVRLRSTGTFSPWCSQARKFARLSGNKLTHPLAVFESGPNSADIESWVDQKVELQGWISVLRKHGKIAFANLRDGSTERSIQLVLKAEQVTQLSIGSAVVAQGVLVGRGRGGQVSYEIQVESIAAQGENDAESCPVQAKHYHPQFLRTVPHLRSRHDAQASLLLFRSQMIASLQPAMSTHGFVQVHTPIITSSDCEGAGEVFTISTKSSSKSDVEQHFFRQPRYLTVSAQLHLEALATAMGKVFTLSPTFRAEKSDTSRHLSEFYMLEAEMSFTDDLESVMAIVESTIRESVTATLTTQTHLREQLLKRAKAYSGQEDHEQAGPEALERRWQGIAREEWPRITYEKAIEALGKAESQGHEFENAVSYEGGLQADHEKFLAAELGNGSPLFVTDYPRDQKPFYMSPSPGSHGQTVACFDLLVPDLGEIAGGSVREHRSHALLRNMQEKGMIDQVTDEQRGDPAYGEKQPLQHTLDWYMDLRKYGSVPHGGYGLGFDRLLCYLTGVNNIRDMVAFPRWYGHCSA